MVEDRQPTSFGWESISNNYAHLCDIWSIACLFSTRKQGREYAALSVAVILSLDSLMSEGQGVTVMIKAVLIVLISWTAETF